MDAYLASAELKDTASFYFNISFELLYGCQFRCRGCFVDTLGAASMTDEYYEDLKSIMDSTEQGLYKPFIAFINPTDFLTADNTVEMLSDPRVIDILGRFRRLSFQGTFLNISRAKEIGEVLRAHYSHMELELNILIEPEHIRTEKYLGILQRNRDEVARIIDWPTPIRNFGIMNVYDFSGTKMAEYLKDYDYMNAAVRDLFDTTIDFNFSLGRKGQALTPQAFEKAAGQIKDLFNEAIVSNDRRQFLRFSFGNENDCLVERQYNWHAGKFYLSPLFYERYAAFIPELEVPLTTKTVKDFEDYEELVQLSQYNHMHEKTECESCSMLSTCVDRQILHLMDIYEQRDCLISRDAVLSVNYFGTSKV